MDIILLIKNSNFCNLFFIKNTVLYRLFSIWEAGGESPIIFNKWRIQQVVNCQGGESTKYSTEGQTGRWWISRCRTGLVYLFSVSIISFKIITYSAWRVGITMSGRVPCRIIKYGILKIGLEAERARQKVCQWRGHFWVLSLVGEQLLQG